MKGAKDEKIEDKKLIERVNAGKDRREREIETVDRNTEEKEIQRLWRERQIKKRDRESGQKDRWERKVETVDRKTEEKDR